MIFLSLSRPAYGLISTPPPSLSNSYLLTIHSVVFIYGLFHDAFRNRGSLFGIATVLRARPRNQRMISAGNKRLFSSPQRPDCCGTHQSSFYSGCKAAGHELAPYLHLMPKIRMCGTVPLFLPTSSWRDA
jgi:hypothetical protein